jgi:hypothetical protein
MLTYAVPFGTVFSCFMASCLLGTQFFLLYWYKCTNTDAEDYPFFSKTKIREYAVWGADEARA